MALVNYAFLKMIFSLFILICFNTVQAKSLIFYKPELSEPSRYESDPNLLYEKSEAPNQDFQNKLRLLLRLPSINEDQESMEPLAHLPMPIRNQKRRGSSCMFHAGLASNCDYRALIGEVSDVRHWGSDLTPGRKKRKQFFKN